MRNSRMKIFLIILVLALAGTGFYGYRHNPEGCSKLGGDFAAAAGIIKTDIVAVYIPSDSPVISDQAPHPVSEVLPASAAPSVSATPSAWMPPTPIPSAPNWTWTTSSGTFRNVRILKVEADCVTILHADGGGLVPMASLSPDLQKELNYDPIAASAAALQRQKDNEVTRDALAQEKAAQQFEGGTTDYSAALAQAKVAGRLLLLHFTGSDWCPYCKLLDSEVISTAAFEQFSATHYIVVTLDFPRNSVLPDSLKQQNNQLAQKYDVHGYPTLVVIDGNEKELGRTTGYDPGTGPGPVIADLQGYNSKR